MTLIKICNISTLLSYIASVYILASIYYLIFTKQYGTPFINEVNKIPRLKNLREDSSRKRKNIFYQGIILSIIILIILHPFYNCVK